MLPMFVKLNEIMKLNHPKDLAHEKRLVEEILHPRIKKIGKAGISLLNKLGKAE